jgi:DUF1365 family protein
MNAPAPVADQRGAEVCLGRVFHRRLRPLRHQFAYPVFYVRLPLRRLESCRRVCFSLDAWNLLSFHRRDHGPRDGSDLLPWIESRLRSAGLPADGEILLQTFPRVLGHVFNPVSFWWCHDRADRLIAVLAEVNNTFGGTHAYLLHADGAALRDGQVMQVQKRLQVSPFNRVEGHYRFTLWPDRAHPLVRIDYHDAEGGCMQTSVSARHRRRWSSANLLASWVRMPLMTLGVVLRIHFQALLLWSKRVPFHGAHPQDLPKLEETQP